MGGVLNVARRLKSADTCPYVNVISRKHQPERYKSWMGCSLDLLHSQLTPAHRDSESVGENSWLNRTCPLHQIVDEALCAIPLCSRKQAVCGHSMYDVDTPRHTTGQCCRGKRYISHTVTTDHRKTPIGRGTPYIPFSLLGKKLSTSTDTAGMYQPHQALTRMDKCQSSRGAKNTTHG